jgi:hypothetical protein
LGDNWQGELERLHFGIGFEMSKTADPSLKSTVEPKVSVLYQRLHYHMGT